jgi:hypothetical protein
MKAFSPVLAVASLFLAITVHAGSTQAYPTVSSPFTPLRTAPLFDSPTIPLAKTWGISIPIGTSFEVEKVYGRWVFGHPLPLPHMPAKDFSASGWIFSRALLLPGDADTLSPEILRQSRVLLYHARVAWEKLGLGKEPLPSPLDFLESLTLSKRTLSAFSGPEVAPKAQSSVTFFPAAYADEQPAAQSDAPMGLTGADLRFLDQEIKVVQRTKQKEAQIREMRRAKVPSPPPLDEKTREGILGRFMLDRYLDLPPLSLEEVDGYIYMRATAMRALQGCSVETQNYWKKRRWGFFRVYRLKSRPEIKQPWFEIALPGGYFGVSGKAIELASDEAELAFLLVRQLVRELHVKRPAVKMGQTDWPKSLVPKAEELWDRELKVQSTKENEGFDVADDIAIDMQAIECISKAGYRPMSAIAYLKKQAFHREDPWATWYAQHAIGLDYRIERVTELAQEALAEQKFPEGKDGQSKRFASAVKQWNILP